ncbi:MAG: dihydroorotate dehydrogenase-like protein [Salinivirgaceae bacterium]|jgi:dihydroorotate dehydrogenase (fumarate)|nr:dihydroorotate dehydrogenase-like protein [Salinivirgaceae bacterium]
MANLSTHYAGLALASPIIAASSGLTETVENVIELEKVGVGAVVLKSIFEEEILMEMEQIKQQMTGKPYVFPETMDYMDDEPHEDLIRKYLRLISEAKSAVKIPIIASINCISNQKWTYLASEIEKAGADAIELNLFSLPSENEMPASEIEEMYLTLVNKVCKQVNIPVTIKISHYYTALGQMIKKFSKTGTKGIVLFNRYYSPDIDINSEEISGSFVLSSPNEIALPLRWIGLMSGNVKTDFAATTGIHSSKSAIKAILAGATVVQIASVIYKEGLSVVNEFNSDILNWMKEKDYECISDFKGKLCFKGADNPASWERVQFMKEFRHFVK